MDIARSATACGAAVGEADLELPEFIPILALPSSASFIVVSRPWYFSETTADSIALKKCDINQAFRAASFSRFGRAATRSTCLRRSLIPRYIALLRAINVGGHTVKMDHLRALFAELGFRNVATLIASGNVTFDASTADATMLESKIEQHLEKRLGFLTDTFARSREEVEAVAAHRAFATARIHSAHALWIAFLKKEPSRAAASALMAAQCRTDEFHVHGREVYWLRHATSSESEFTGSLDKILGMPVTARNITTVRKLAAM